MTRARVLRRALQVEERVPLGVLPHPAPLAADRPVAGRSTQSQSGPQPAPQRERARQEAEQLAAQLTGQLTGQLRAQLDQSEQERRQLRAALDELQAGTAAAVKEARQQAQQEALLELREEARREGHAEGLKAAELQMQREREQCTAHWRAAIDEASRQYEVCVASLRGELAEVVMASVAKLLGEHLLDPQSIRAAIEQTLRESGIGSAARVLIAPAQYEQMLRVGAAHLAALRERHIEVAPDPRVSCGGCLVETPHGLTDGRFEVQLARLREILAGHYSAGQHRGEGERSVPR